MVNPIFFALVFIGLRGRLVVISLICGAILGPLLHMVSAEWGLLLAGVGGGTLAFMIMRHWNNREAEASK